MLAGCTHTSEIKEWNDKYDPSEWRKQFEKCRKLLYTAYPEEIKREEWSNCINEKNYG